VLLIRACRGVADAVDELAAALVEQTLFVLSPVLAWTASSQPI
jgi:hypothetical protein